MSSTEEQRQAELAERRQQDTDHEARTARWAELYEWLGEQAKSSAQEAEDNELAANLDASVGPMYHAEALVEVRRQMRRKDPSLPKVPGIDSGLT